ncbi:hypothetical protein [Spirulina sp. 06S082]|uniref:hypothetical protein n=1 Tax=Spirulina sp. 06S082 TaxID=3110248 RepID=UPI002B1F324A|nr:hypothetical protein [Spirulina sp. 06S082]MEA5470869.1 hypothetical protein [Spirulina sp. 06S082]
MKMWKLVLGCLTFVLSFALAWPMQAHAYDKSCVSLLVGAGYAAEMRTEINISGNVLYTEWSGSFPIGKTECQDISFVPEGSTFVAQVHAILGETKPCNPTITQAGGVGSAVWQANGTTLNVKCNMPSM